MIRFFIVMLQVGGILLLNLFFNNTVSLKIDAAGRINAGKDIKVQVTLAKPNVTGFARFQMILPAGITAVNGYSADADFSFKDQKVRLIWLRVPEENNLTFYFTIHCNKYLKGNFDLSGTFSYISDNNRESVELLPQTVAIIPSSTIDPKLIVDIKDYGTSIYSQMPVSPADIACVREKPVWSASAHDYLVTLLVNKENLKKFAKIEEVVPKGYTALNVDSKNGVFTFKDHKAKFLWMNLPEGNYFTVQYKLIPLNQHTAGEPTIDGEFSYINDDNTQSVQVVQKDVDLANLTPELVKSILSSPVTPNNNLAVNTSSPTKQQTIATTAGKTDSTGANTSTDTSLNTEKPASQAQNSIAANTSQIINQLQPKNGVYYRVQVAAGHRPVNVKRYFRKYKLDNTIYKEHNKGWIKYSVGTFNIYKEARDYRVHIWNTTTIADAFVAAYNNGKRITVQEALMITSQRWYQ